MPSQDNENAMDGLLRRSLARDSAARGDCPDAELLAAYFDQSLGADEAAGYELHFSNCPRCREQLATMVRANAGQQLHPADLALEPALAGARPVPAITLGAARTQAQPKPAVSIARSETKLPERKSLDARWLDLRWLIPVAAMLVLGTVVFMRFASHETTVGLNNQVAVSKPAAPPQDQSALEPEKKPSDAATPEPAAPNNQPSAASTPSRSRSSIASATSAAANPQRNERASARSATASRNAPAPITRPSQTAGGRASSFQSNKQFAGAISSATVQKYQKAASEPAPAAPAPAAPAPELNASMAKIPVAAASADAVKSPAPPPPPGAATKIQGFGMGGRNIRSSAATKSAEKAKPAEEGYTETVISTPDSDVFYRIAGGGFVEISEDGGATWQRQLLNPSAEFTAGSAPEPRICWLVGRSGIVFLTEDGKSWRKLPSPTSENLVVVVAKSASNATVTANDDQKWSTDDSGKSWRATK
jgi:hypothetical protein